MIFQQKESHSFYHVKSYERGYSSNILWYFEEGSYAFTFFQFARQLVQLSDELSNDGLRCRKFLPAIISYGFLQLVSLSLSLSLIIINNIQTSRGIGFQLVKARWSEHVFANNVIINPCIRIIDSKCALYYFLIIRLFLTALLNG